MTIAGIYTFENIITGKQYIGQAANIKQRINQHYAALARGNHRCIYLQRAFGKYGKEAFEGKVLEECPKEKLTEREQYWMDFYREKGIYNSAPAAGSSLGIKRRPETIAKVIAANRGRRVGPETRAKMSAAGKGRKWSAETRKKMATVPPSMLGKHHSEEHKAKLRALNLGKKMPPDAIAKTAAAHRGMKRSPEARARMSAAHQNRSAETRERMSKAQIGHVMSAQAKANWMAAIAGKVGRGKGGRFVSCANNTNLI